MKRENIYIQEIDCVGDEKLVTSSNSATRVKLRNDSMKMKIRVESCFSPHESTRVTISDSSQSHFYKSQNI